LASAGFYVSNALRQRSATVFRVAQFEAFPMSIANRPLSPHLQVYKPQITSLLSISHRATGVALSAGTILLIWQLLAAASGPEAFYQFQGFIGSWFGLTLLAAWSFSMFFHLANGIRHLAWDAGYGYDLETTYRSGVFVIVLTVALTLVAWFAALTIWRA
jgi:succinate dehydrogenase / fumarate reductase cytochrome b subunit